MLSRIYAFIRGNSVTVPVEKPESKAPQPIINQKQPESQNSTTIINSNLNNQVTPCDTDTDDLEKYMCKLQSLVYSFEDERKRWQEHKYKLPPCDSIQHLSEPRREMNIGSFFADLLIKLKAVVRATDKNLDDLLAELRPKLVKLCEDLHQSTDNAIATNTSEAEKLQLSHHMCDDCLIILNEVITFINKVQTFISLALKTEEIGEHVAIKLADFVVMLLTDVSLTAVYHKLSTLFPILDINLTSLYRKFLFNEIQPEANQIRSLLASTESEMARAENVVQKEIEHTQPQAMKP